MEIWTGLYKPKASLLSTTNRENACNVPKAQVRSMARSSSLIRRLLGIEQGSRTAVNPRIWAARGCCDMI